MAHVQDTSDRAAEPPVCPECAKADHVEKLSAIPDWPAEYGPPDRPVWFDLLGVVSVAGGLLLALALAYVLRSGTGELDVECLVLVAVPPISYGFARLASKRRQKAQWEEGVSRWERLYFCLRDEVAFLPGSRYGVPLHKIRDFLLYRL